MIRRTVEKMSFDYARDIMSVAYKLAKVDPQKAVDMMSNSGLEHLIPKISNIPAGMKPTKIVIEQIKHIKPSPAINPTVAIGCVVGIAVVAGSAYVYKKRQAKKNTVNFILVD
jgi:hypothetical protein